MLLFDFTTVRNAPGTVVLAAAFAAGMADQDEDDDDLNQQDEDTMANLNSASPHWRRVSNYSYPYDGIPIVDSLTIN